MPTELFVERSFKPATLAVIDTANSIIAEYQRQGFTLTLRQLYYQFVARDLLPNRQSEYKRLGAILSDARLAGLVDWSAIEDRTRNLVRQPAWESPERIIEAVASQYQEDLWEGQERRVEVWIEKDALIGVIEPVCKRWRLPFFACRGNASQSELYAAGKRLKAWRRLDQKPLVLHLGDHDPSGIDMTRDNSERLGMFAKHFIEVKRIALNFDQIEQYGPPPNPVKDSDSRADGYIEKFGASSWELDALDPIVIDKLIEDEIDSVVDRDEWARAEEQEERNRSLLEGASNRWDDVVRFLERRA